MEFHYLTEVNQESKTGICSVCGLIDVVFKKKKGVIKRFCGNKAREHRRRYRKTSAKYKAAEKRRRRIKLKIEGRTANNWKYRRHVKPICERCGYEAVHPCLIDGHHRDGDRKNNKPDNIASLCVMCHRIEHLPDNVKDGLDGPGNVKNNKIPELLDSMERLALECSNWEKKYNDMVENGVSESISVAHWYNKCMVAEKRAADLENQLSGSG